MDAEQRAQAVFGAFDGTASIIGLTYGLAINGYHREAILVAGISAAISATVSMATGLYESEDCDTAKRFRLAAVMGCATLVGSLVVVVPYLLPLSVGVASVVAGALALCVGVWIGHQKHRGVSGYLFSVGVLLACAGFAAGIAAAIPAGAGG